MDLSGGCLCGAVRYTSSGAPFRQFVCHCRDCQRASGSMFHAGLAVPKSGFKLTSGELKTFESAGDSGRKVKRGFCPTCGAGIANEPEVWPEYVVIRIGTLDDPNILPAPSHELNAKARAPWISIDKQI